ncbi:acetyl-CoA synthetase-like protein [Dendrothele bispora CBS 962.96]|uniref:Acetyl-CoA synthetase-like protein n=1 Tax=Dendrothele bispora (strain CBS 962.96) TaxID=1314807 RepID=A0A4S8MXP1_DENBC|nr:acetyl-CoA synthetase-like protein [Dendrothele bispora CBS 962.96]
MTIRAIKRIPPTPRTFSPPALDGSYSLLQMYDWHREHSPRHRLFVFARADGTIREIYWPEAVSAIYVGAKLIRDRLPPVRDYPPDTIPYYTTMLSIIRANYIVFPISSRNSAAAVAHLIAKANVGHILIGRDTSMQDLLTNTFEILKTQYQQFSLPGVSSMPLFEDLYTSISDEEIDVIRGQIPLLRQNPEDIQLYLHSSGSTAFPKPIPWTTQRLIEHCLIPIFGEQDLTNQVIGVHTLPMFHATGSLTLSWTASCGFVLAAFEPQSPAILPTPENAFQGAKATECDFVYSVPSQLEAWSSRSSYLEYLSTRRGVIFSGGPLHREVGDLLTSRGINVYIIYGRQVLLSTEPPGYDWEYFQLSGVVKPKLLPSNDGTFQLIMVTNPYFTPSVINTKVDGEDAYDTADLLLEHPNKPGYWRVFGRADSQIIHSTGEKTNPGPLESILNQDQHVTACVMFGQGKFQAGVLVEPKPEYQFDPSDMELLINFRNKIWPSIERMNQHAPQHSRIFKEMILVALPNKPFTYTAKNTTRAPAILKEYAGEIEALYKIVDESTQSNIPIPAKWDITSVTPFVRQVVQQVLSRYDLSDEADLFQHGCDSLQATWIRNSLLRALRDSPAGIDTRESTGNFVYEHPSVNLLSKFLASAAQNGFSADQDATETEVEKMKQMVEKYSKDFPNLKSPKAASSSKTVLVTGTTGGFGTHILETLFFDPLVSKIYVLIRKGSVDIKQKQEKSFAERGVDITFLNSDKVRLLEADLVEQKFGLDADVFEEIADSVTHIIANAWRVDFNLGLRSFENDIKGLRCMVDFALSTASVLVFVSSIGIFQNFSSAQQRPFPEDKVDPVIASGSGYSESKWVSEQIISEAAKIGLHSVVVRLGQVCGSPNGLWNRKEWLPAIVQSAAVLNCLPDDERSITWIPAQLASRALVDILNIPSDGPGSPCYVHLIHPRPISWSKLAETIASRLQVELVSYSEWFDRLNQAGKLDPEAAKNIAALKILPFYKDVLARVDASDCEAFAFPEIEVKQALQLSPTLSNRDIKQLGEDDAERWLSYWGCRQSKTENNGNPYTQPLPSKTVRLRKNSSVSQLIRKTFDTLVLRRVQ